MSSTGRLRAVTLPADAGPMPSAVPAGQVAVADEKAQMMRALLREMRDHVVQHARDVGAEFASEARRMHEEKE